MKKLLLTLGSIAAVAAPVASVVACGAPAPKHVKLNKTKVETMLPDIKTAVMKVLTGGGLKPGQIGPSIDDGVVAESGVNLTVTFTVTSPAQKAGDADSIDKLVVTVSQDGNVEGVASPTMSSLPNGLKEQLQTVMKAGTIENSGTTDPVSYDRTSIDDAVAMKSGLTVPDALATGASNTDIQLFNAKVSAFMPKYQKALADETASILNAVDSLDMNIADYDGLAIGNGSLEELTETTMNSLHLDPTTVAKIVKLISEGVSIQISKPSPGDISGVIDCNGKAADLNFKVGAMLSFKDRPKS